MIFVFLIDSQLYQLYQYLRPSLANIHLHGAECVDGEPLVRVDGDTEEARVGVDQLGLVPHHRVPEDAGVAKESQVGHVLGHVELGWVHLHNDTLLVFIKIYSENRCLTDYAQ